MRTLTLVDYPSFPLKLKRSAKVCKAWLKEGKQAFQLRHGRHRHFFSMKAEPKHQKSDDGDTLIIDAAKVTPVAEVWDTDSNKPCRVWFDYGGKIYEASKLTGWKPRLSAAPVRVPGTIQAAKAASIAAVQI